MRGNRRILPRMAVARRIQRWLDNRMTCPIPGRNAATGQIDLTAVGTQTFCDIVRHPSGDGRVAILIHPDAAVHLPALRALVIARIGTAQEEPEDRDIRDAPAAAALADDWIPAPGYTMVEPVDPNALRVGP